MQEQIKIILENTEKKVLTTICRVCIMGLILNIGQKMKGVQKCLTRISSKARSWKPVIHEENLQICLE